MNDSTLLQCIFDAVSDHKRFMDHVKSSPRTALSHRVCVQMAWNSRRAARHWVAELDMTKEERFYRDVVDCIKRVKAEINFHRAAGSSDAAIRNWAGVWVDAGDMAYTPRVRELAIKIVFGNTTFK